MKKSTKKFTSTFLAAASVAGIVVPATQVFAEEKMTLDQAKNLIAEAKKTKAFVDFNYAYGAIMELSTAGTITLAERDALLAQLPAWNEVATPDVEKALKMIDVVSQKLELKEYDETLAYIEKEVKLERNVQYLAGDLAKWGYNKVYTQDVMAAVDAINKVWTEKTEAAEKAAQEAIKNVKNANNLAYLNVSLGEASKVVVRLLKVEDFTVSSTKSLKVKFSQEIKDTSKIVFSVKNGNVVVNTTPTWNESKTEATLTTTVGLSTGTYTLKVSGADFADGKDTASVLVAPERVETIQLDAAGYRDASTSTTVVLGYKLFNQYGEDITTSMGTTNLIPTSSKGTASVTSAGVITITGVGATETNNIITLVDKKYAKSVSNTITINASKSISEITLGQPQIKTGKTKLEANVTDYVIPYVAKDQYGNEVTLSAADLSKITFVSSDKAAFDPDAANAVEVKQVDGKDQLTVDFKAFAGAKDVTITAIVNATGKSSGTTFTVFGTATADTPTLVAPTTRIGNGDTAFKVELVMKDQYGNDMTADAIVAAASGLTITSGNTSILDLNTTKVVKSGEKAYVQIDALNEGTANITVTVNSTGKSVTLPITVVAAKYAATMTLVPNYTYAVPGASIVVKATFKDQYGDDITTPTNAVKFVADKNDFAAAPANSDVATMYSTGVTLSPNAYDKTSKYTVKLYAADGTTVLDTKEITLTSVKQDAELTYAITDLGTVAAASKATAAYEKAITIYAKDASGNKVALPASGVIQAVTSADSKLDATALLSNKVKAAAVDTEGTASFNVIVATNKGVKTLTGSVNFSKETPKASKLQALAGTTVITKATLTSGATVNLTNNATLKFAVTDQYETTALTDNSYLTVFVEDSTGNVNKVSDITNWTVPAAGTYKLTAVTSNGLTYVVELTVQ